MEHKVSLTSGRPFLPRTRLTKVATAWPPPLFLALLFVWMFVVGRHLTRAPRGRNALRVVLIAGLLGLGGPVCAQSTIALYPGVAPGSEGWTSPETVVTLEPPGVGTVITHVSKPRLAVFRPDSATQTRTAVIVAPGGHSTF